MHKINPVLVSGIKRRMRGRRTLVLTTAYFLLLLAVFGLTYQSVAGTQSYSSYYYYSAYHIPRPGVAGADLLMPMYAFLVVGILLLVLLLVPALNAGNISSEREKQTLDLLISSKLSAIKIVLGKVFANLAFTAYLLMLALPFFAVLFLFGSIVPLDVILVYVFMIITAYACASIATFFSALMKKTAMATILTYVTLIVFCIITVVGGIMTAADPSYTANEPPLILRLNPLYALVELVINATTASTSTADTVLLFGGDGEVASVIYSAIFMLLASPLINIASAMVIKPVQKFQISSRPPAPVYHLNPPAPAAPQPFVNTPPAMQGGESYAYAETEPQKPEAPAPGSPPENP